TACIWPVKWAPRSLCRKKRRRRPGVFSGSRQTSRKYGCTIAVAWTKGRTLSFHEGRSCHDALETVFRLLGLRPHSPPYRRHRAARGHRFDLAEPARGGNLLPDDAP